MSTFKDVMDLITVVNDDIVDNIFSTKKMQSLSRSAQEGTLNFPVIVSNTLSLEDATLINKALEKEYASFILTAMTMNPYLDDGTTPSAASYIKRFHQNMGETTSGTDVFNAALDLVGESANMAGMNYTVIETEHNPIAACLYENVNDARINQDNARYNYTIDDIANPGILNHKANRKLLSAVMEAKDGGKNGNNKPPKNRYNKSNTIDIRVKYPKDSGGGSGSAKPTGPTLKDVKLLMDNDVKKANELVPTLMHIRVYPTQPAGSGATQQLAPFEFIIGIKATLHPVSSEEMITNMARGIKNHSVFFNFLRWTTGETKFFRDFLFSIDELKVDAVNSGNRSSHWWTALKRRKNLSRMKNRISKEQILPNATIVITKDEVEMIRRQYGYNLMEPKMMRSLMSNYFLLGFVIVDPALQTASFLFDGKAEPEVQTFATLAREASASDRQFKEMITMLGRRI